jgi:polysaccharide biosynthesis transport protein
MTSVNSSFVNSESPRDISLRDLVSPLFRRKTLLITAFVSILVLVILVGVLVPPPFKSQMSVLVNRERVDPLVTTETTTQIPANGSAEVSVEEINSEAELLLSQDILEKVVVATGLDKQQPSSLDWLLPVSTPAERIAHAAKHLAKAIKVKNETNSNLIDVSYSSNNPQRAFAVLNALSNFYVQKHTEVHRPPGSFKFFEAETQKYHTALQKSESDLKNFSRHEHIAAPDLVRADLAQQVALATGQLYTSRQAIAADEQRIHSDRAQLKVTPERSPTQQATSQADKLLDTLGATLLAAQTKRTQLLLKYEANYPLVLEVDQEIAQAKAAIAEAKKTRYVTEDTDRDPTHELLREDLARSETDLAAQRGSADAAKRGIDAIQAEMVELDQKASEQGDLLREVKANEDNYLLYLAKREQERTSDALDETRIGNVAIAVPPAIPVLRIYSVPIVIVVAFLAAFFLSIAMVYIVDYFDSSFHNPSQVIDTLGIPVVVSMPRRTA